MLLSLWMLLLSKGGGAAHSAIVVPAVSFALALKPLKARRVLLGSGGNASTYVCYFFKRKSSGSDAVGNICTWGWVESEMRCSWCKALAGWGAAVCWGLLLSTLKHGFGRGLVACCQPQLACPSLSSFLLTALLPPNSPPSCFKVTFPGQT